MKRILSQETIGNSSEYDSVYEALFKILLIGDPTVGKSSLMSRYVDDEVKKEHIYTIGADFKIKTMYLENHIPIKLQIWDTAGQERFRTLTRLYYRGAHGVFIVYDVTNLASFEHVKGWFKEAHDNMEDPFKILIGNKRDCPKEKRKVPKKFAEKFAKEKGILYLETSALTGKNVEKAFILMAENIRKRRKGPDVSLIQPNQSIMLHSIPEGREIEGEVPSLYDSCCN